MHKIAETEMLEDYEGLTHYVIGLNTTTTPGIKTVKAGKTFTVLVG